MMRESGEALMVLRQDMGLTQAEFARQIGVPASTISVVEAGKRGLNARSLEQIATAIGCRLIVDADGWSVVYSDKKDSGSVFPEGNPNRDREVETHWGGALPVLGRASAGPGSFVDEHGVEWVSVQRMVQQRLDGVVVVEGESMSPMLEAGDLVGLRRYEELQFGDVVVAQDRRCETVLIKVWGGYSEDRGMAFLHSVNPGFGALQIPAGEIELLGCAYGVIRMERLRVHWTGTDQL